jgi:dolichyl-phosphate-mannose-protein mannosyltransferase
MPASTILVTPRDGTELFPSPRARPGRSAFALWPVVTIAAVAGLATGWASAVRAYQYDELYFMASGRYLSWGYADQPPLVPLWARLADHMAPGSSLVFRLPAVLLFVAGIVATAAIAREFGGRARAQTLAAVVYAVSPWLVIAAQWTATYSFDPHLWTIVFWLVVRAVGRPGQRRYWGLLCAGLVTTVDLQVKFLIPLLWISALIAALAIGPRWLVRRVELWAGLAVAAICCVPTLRWQADHGWPYAQMQQVVAAESPRITLIPVGLVGFGVISGMVFAVYGLWRLLRSVELAQWRFLGFATAGSVVCLLIASGRSYYLADYTGLLVAAGAVGVQAARPARWWGWSVTGRAIALSALFPVLLLPLGPSGWNPFDRLIHSAEVSPAVATGARDAYTDLPPAQRAHTALVAQTYPLASAVDAYSSLRAYSPHRGYWYFRTPPASADQVIWIGDDPTRVRQWFTTVTRLPSRPGEPPMWKASGRRADWTTIWDSWRRMI